MSRGIDGMMRAIGQAVIPHSAPQSERCPNGCGERLQFGTDAIGRETARCPKCDGVAPRRRINPNEALIPQGLVPAYRPLPPAAPGEPCAHCGRRVPKHRRRHRPAPRPRGNCLGCGDQLKPHRGRTMQWCERPECEAKAPARIRYQRKHRRMRALEAPHGASL